MFFSNSNFFIIYASSGFSLVLICFYILKTKIVLHWSLMIFFLGICCLAKWFYTICLLLFSLTSLFKLFFIYLCFTLTKRAILYVYMNNVLFKGILYFSIYIVALIGISKLFSFWLGEGNMYENWIWCEML